MLNMGQNQLWWEAHRYKLPISIFEEVAFELLFGLGVNWLEKYNFFDLKNFQSTGFPIRLLTKKKYILIMLDTSWTVFKWIFSTF